MRAGWPPAMKLSPYRQFFTLIPIPLSVSADGQRVARCRGIYHFPDVLCHFRKSSFSNRMQPFSLGFEAFDSPRVTVQESVKSGTHKIVSNVETVERSLSSLVLFFGFFYVIQKTLKATQASKHLVANQFHCEKQTRHLWKD